MNKHTGFTLIELLVVIAIIGMLSSVVLASLNSARAKARDANRSVEVRQLVTAIQSYIIDNNGSFPPNNGCTGGWCCLGHGSSGNCWANGYKGSTLLDNTLSPTYISTIPDDPLNNTSRYGDAYMYNITTNPANGIASPEIHWGIENASPTAAKDCLGGTLGNWGSGLGNGGNYFCHLWIN